MLESWYGKTSSREELVKLFNEKLNEVDAKIQKLKKARKRLEKAKKELESGKC
jgi:replication-associated recombination protein RarA